MARLFSGPELPGKASLSHDLRYFSAKKDQRRDWHSSSVYIQ